MHPIRGDLSSMDKMALSMEICFTENYPNIAILYLIIPHRTESYPSPRPAR